jgi:tungstate transport system substrate-binding protein
MNIFAGLFALLLSFSIFGALAEAAATQAVTNTTVILATTTSTQDSGLLDVLVPMFEKKTGYVVKTIAVGTGQALAMGRRGDADVLLVHAPAEEEKFVAEGHGTKREPFMFNDFVLIGPAGDPAKIAKAPSVVEALRLIAASQALFLSRGDNSGTHILEKQLWTESGLQPGGAWYQQSGQGMGQTLVIASEKRAYALSDRGTYLSLKKRLELSILFRGDPKLLNIYSVIPVNPQKSSSINSAGAQAFSAFVLSQEAFRVIETYGREKYGEPLFRLMKK